MISRNLNLACGMITNMDEMYANHEAADAGIPWLAFHTVSTCSRVVIRSPDTDVSIFMVHFSQG